MSGRSVEIPKRVERVACLEVLCYSRMFMLGAADRVVRMYRTAAPWMEATNPRVDGLMLCYSPAKANDLRLAGFHRHGAPPFDGGGSPVSPPTIGNGMSPWSEGGESAPSERSRAGRQFDAEIETSTGVSR